MSVRVRGQITAASVSQRTSSDRSSFFPAVRYEYRFEGRVLTGERIGFVDIGAQYPGVAEVDVYVLLAGR